MKHPLPLSLSIVCLTTLLVGAVLGSVRAADEKVAEKADENPLYYYRTVPRGPEKLIECDVAVYGGTPAGVGAAIQAARMGKKVVFLTFNRHVGGLSSGGLTATDVGNRSAIGGMAMEFYKRVGKLRDFRPSRAETVFLEMLEEAGVTVLFERCLESVAMEDGRLLSMTLETGETVKAAMFVDSTYEGDLLAAANVSYYVGREPSSAYGETLAGQWQTVSWQDVYQFCRLPISPYVKAHDPESGLLPEIASEAPGKPGEGDYRVQAYNFRIYLTDKEGKIPFPKPRGYDPGRFALLERFLNFDPAVQWKLNYTTAAMTDGPVQMRNGDSNNAGSFSSDYVGGNFHWPDGTYEGGSFAELPPPKRGLPIPLRDLYELREQIFQDHVNYQQGLMYFLANDERVPEELQQRVNAFGLDPEEFQDTGFWPHQLYIREGRRMVSDYVMTQKNCESKETVPDSVGLAAYAMDSHFCQRVVVEENGVTTVRNEGGFGHACPKPYPVSYRSIIPKREECENLLVPLCLSSSHVAYGSIRMEPVFLILGQSAGTAAALAIDGGIALQDLDYGKLKAKLEAAGQLLAYVEKPKPAGRFTPIDTLGGIVVDESDAVLKGNWKPSSLGVGIHQGYRHDGNARDGESTAEFLAKLPAPGKYQVEVAFSKNANRASNVPVEIIHADGSKVVELNQRQAPTIDGHFSSVGTFRFGKSGKVTISNRGTDGFVVIDAVRWVPKPDQSDSSRQ